MTSESNKIHTRMIPMQEKDQSVLTREDPFPGFHRAPHATVISTVIIGRDVSHHLATLLNSFLPTFVRHFPTLHGRVRDFRIHRAHARIALFFCQPPSSPSLTSQPRSFIIRLFSAATHFSPTLHGRLLSLPSPPSLALSLVAYDIFASQFYYL